MEVSLQIAKYLLEIQAVKLSPDAPFTWSSGWKSPIYCDNRLVLSYPEIRTFLKNAFSELIAEKFPTAQTIAGVATAGIAHGALIADKMELSYIYVRTSPKSHGMKNLIEGKVDTEKVHVVVEDLISTGGSSIKVIEALQEANISVAGTVAIFNYGFPQATAAFAEKNSPFYSLCSLADLLQVATEMNYIDATAWETIQNWQKNPSEWGR
ncbi:MAG: orotate phosphoribosyltransferase [Bacteroidia bacterium]